MAGSPQGRSSGSPATGGPAETLIAEGSGFYDPDCQSALIDLSSSVIRASFNSDLSGLRHLFGERCVCLVPLGDTFDNGLLAFEETLAALKRHHLVVVFAHMTFRAYPHTPDLCTVICSCFSYMGWNDVPRQLLSRPFRATLNWARGAGGRPLITCLEYRFPFRAASFWNEASVPIVPSTLDRPEVFEALTWEHPVEVRDRLGVTHVVYGDDVRYVEAKGRATVLHCLDERIEANEGIGAMAERLGPEFIRIHRTYLVNAWHLRHVTSKGAMLDDGTTVPVSVRRIGEIHDAIAEVRRPKGLSVRDAESLVRGALDRK